MINYTLRYIVVQLFILILATIDVIYNFIYGQLGYTNVFAKLNLKNKIKKSLLLLMVLYHHIDFCLTNNFSLYLSGV